MSYLNRLAILATLGTLLLPLAAAAGGPAGSPARTPSGEAAAAAPFAATRAADPASFRVFVDLPTGYAFVSTPKGWVFRGKLAPEQYAGLPAGTYVSLVPAAQVAAPELTASALSGTAAGAF